jgi:hypothetical protein
MKRFNLLVALIAVACFLSACGLSNAQKAQPSPTPERNTAPRTGVNSNSVVFTNSNANIKVANVPTIPAAGDAPLVNGSVERRRDRLRERERFEEDPSATPPPIAFQKAPENSEFAAYMEKGGMVVETRIFKGHPQLNSVIMKWIDPQTRALKVTLQNGKVVERQPVRIANLRTVSTTELLNIIGIKPEAGRAVPPPAAPKR